MGGGFAHPWDCQQLLDSRLNRLQRSLDPRFEFRHHLFQMLDGL